jgi:hypothetical protein
MLDWAELPISQPGVDLVVSEKTKISFSFRDSNYGSSSRWPSHCTDLHLVGFHSTGRDRDSSVGIATRYLAGRSGDRIPVGSEIFRTRPDRPWGSPSVLYNGYRVFPGGKATRAWRCSPTPSSAEVKERVGVYLYSPSGQRLRWSSGYHAGLWYPRSRVRTRPKPSYFSGEKKILSFTSLPKEGK